MNQWLDNYVAAQKAALDSIPPSEVAGVISTFQKVLAEDRQIFVFGKWRQRG